MSQVNVRIQQTPNPNSMLYLVDATVTDERMVQFNSADEASEAPLAKALFGIDGVVSVFFMPNSITVSKTPEVDWNDVGPRAEEAIRSHFVA